MSNVQKFREPVMAPEFLTLDGSAVGGSATSGTPTSGSGSASVEESAAAVQKAVFTLNISDGDWLNATDSVELELGSLGREVLCLGTVGDLVLTKKGALLSTTDIDLGVGIIANTSNPSVMAGDEDLLCEKLDFNDDTLSLDMEWSHACVVARDGNAIIPSANSVWLNMYANVGADSTYDLTGTVTVYFVDLG